MPRTLRSGCRWATISKYSSGLLPSNILEVLDCLISAIKERFKQPAFLVYKDLESLIVNAAQGNDIAKGMEELSSHFSGDVCLAALEAQLNTFKVMMSRHNSEVECFDDMWDLNPIA